ncbi:unnamed protein product, partial [Prorocentrum cordatum]
SHSGSALLLLFFCFHCGLTGRQRLLAADGAALHLGRRSVPQGRLPLRRHAGAKVLEAGHPRARGAAARAGAAGLQLMDGELDWGGLRRCATRGAEATALGRQRPAERGLNEHAAVGGCQPFGGPLAERPGGTASRALARVGAVGPGQGADVPEPDQLEALHLAGDAHPGDHRADEPDPLSAPPVPLAPDPPAAHDLVSPSSPGLRTSSAVPPLLPRSLAPSLSSGRLPRERREAPPPAARRPRRQQAARWALRNGER